MPSAGVEVRDGPNAIVFMPMNAKASGLLFFPGGLIDPVAYAAALRRIAEAGYPAILVRVPLIPDLDIGLSGLPLMASLPGVERWIAGGHSFGGSMACRLLARAPDRVAGLVLWASYPGDEDDLSGAIVPVTALFGDSDGLVTPEKAEAKRALLPAHVNWLELAGGNHAQFGDYGPQPNDGQPGISAEEQASWTVEHTLTLLARVSDPR